MSALSRFSGWAVAVLLAGAPGLAEAADCPEPIDSTALTGAIAEAEASFADLDIQAFKEATDRLRGSIPCLGDPVTRQVAAEVHRFLGLRAFGDRDPDAPLFFAAARSLEPEYVFPPDLIPEGNPVHRAYHAYDLSRGQLSPVSEPAAGYLQFDGRTQAARPATWPTLYQRYDAEGGLVESHYLMPSDPLPAYPLKQVRIVVRPETGPPVRVDSPLRPVSPSRGPLVVGTLAAAATTGLLYGLAGVSKGAFNDLATPDEELEPLRKRTNALAVASAVTGTVTVGLGIGLALTW